MYPIVLFVHLLVLALAFFAMGLTMNSLLRLKSARTVGDGRAAVALADKAERIMPLATIFLLATGAYMTQSRWQWTTPWIDVSIAGLAIVTVVGAGVLGGRARALHRSLQAASDERLTPALLAQLRDPALLVGSMANLGLVCGVMFTMVVKPSLGGGIVALLVSAALGALTASPNLRVGKSWRRAAGEA
jgi:hypothetical protein